MCSKIVFYTRGEARAAGITFTRGKMHRLLTYFCNNCKGWHLKYKKRRALKQLRKSKYKLTVSQLLSTLNQEQ